MHWILLTPWNPVLHFDFLLSSFNVVKTILFKNCLTVWNTGCTACSAQDSDWIAESNDPKTPCVHGLPISWKWKYSIHLVHHFTHISSKIHSNLILSSEILGSELESEIKFCVRQSRQQGSGVYKRLFVSSHRKLKLVCRMKHNTYLFLCFWMYKIMKK